MLGKNPLNQSPIMDSVACESVGGSASIVFLLRIHHLPELSKWSHYSLQNISHSPLPPEDLELHSMLSRLPATVDICVFVTDHRLCQTHKFDWFYPSFL